MQLKKVFAGMSRRNLSVLDLSGMELVFPIAALIMLCFGIFVGRKLMTHQHFGYC